MVLTILIIDERFKCGTPIYLLALEKDIEFSSALSDKKRHEPS